MPMPERALQAIRAYLDGRLDIDAALAQAFTVWRDEGWGPYFDEAQLLPEQLPRVREFERRFAALTRAEVDRTTGRPSPPELE
jgi:hypothetical protein